MKALLISLLLLLGLGLASCEETSDAVFTPQLVIEGYLYANEPLDSIVVRRTLEITQDDSLSFVSGAIVTLTTPEGEMRLVERESGRYHPEQPVIVQPGGLYKLRVDAMNMTATSETTVPQAISLDSAKLEDRHLSLTGIDTIDYLKSREELNKPCVRLWWTKSMGYAGYALEATSFDTTAEIIDFEPGDDNLPDSISMGRYRFFILSRSEQLTWRQFRRYGVNTVRALALDRNLQDFALGLYLTRSQFDNNTLHVEGGLGVFGSAARASIRVYVRKTIED